MVGIYDMEEAITKARKKYNEWAFYTSLTIDEAFPVYETNKRFIQGILDGEVTGGFNVIELLRKYLKDNEGNR